MKQLLKTIESPAHIWLVRRNGMQAGEFESSPDCCGLSELGPLTRQGTAKSALAKSLLIPILCLGLILTIVAVLLVVT
jgi:hypothetical protein